MKYGINKTVGLNTITKLNVRLDEEKRIYTKIINSFDKMNNCFSNNKILTEKATDITSQFGKLKKIHSNNILVISKTISKYENVKENNVDLL